MSEVTQAGSVVALSEAAATKVRDLLAREGRDDLALRVAVEPGGCSGLRYALFFDDRPDGDVRGEVNGVAVVTDKMSALPQRRLHRLPRHPGEVRLHDRQPQRRRLLRLRRVVPPAGRTTHHLVVRQYPEARDGGDRQRMEGRRPPVRADGATILATEHWSLLGTRSMIWNEAMSRTTVFLTVLSASIVALALLADATGFGRRTTTVALVRCPWCSCSASRPTAAWSRSTARTWPSPWP